MLSIESTLEILKSGTESALDTLLETASGENLRLEFATVHWNGSKIESGTRSKIGRELSAFANVSGGVLVLGIDKKARGQARKEPIRCIDAFERELGLLATDLLDPPVPIDQIVIPSDSRDGSGYVALHVREASSKPVLNAQDSVTYIRTGECSVKAPGRIVHALALSKQYPDAIIEIKKPFLHSSGKSQSADEGIVAAVTFWLQAEAWLTNTGTMPIREAAFAVSAKRGASITQGYVTKPLDSVVGDPFPKLAGMQLLTLKTGVVAFPGTELEIGTLIMKVEPEDSCKKASDVDYVVFLDGNTVQGTAEVSLEFPQMKYET